MKSVKDKAESSAFKEQSDALEIFNSAIDFLASRSIPFSGEFFVPGTGVAITYEHYLRYLFALEWINPDSVVLDLGCGMGYGSALLSSKAKWVYSIDYNGELIQLVRELKKNFSLINITPIEGKVEDLEEM
ncbi:MAG: methyltransferase domain-containing protein, partial [Candidatus Dadabacteria bacterium]